VLPKIPVKVNQYWAFQTAAADSPTFPVVAFQFYVLSAYDEFSRLLRKADPVVANALTHSADQLRSIGIARGIREIRSVFESNPSLAGRMSMELARSGIAQSDPGTFAAVQSMIEMYGASDHRYLNFYGPPRTIRTFPFHEFLRSDNAPADLRGKAVFVGLSEIALTERKDSFYTTFSRADGVFLSGVEIAATAFANLLRNTPVTPVSPLHASAVVILWGLLIAFIGRLTVTPVVPLAIALVSLAYLSGAVWKFQTDGTWYPVVTPLFIQSPFGMIGAVLWKYLEANKERRNIRKALAHYVPDEVVDHLAANSADVRRDDRTIYGVCLFTDCEGYTAVSERMPTRELSDVMHRYFGVIFHPIKQNGGRVMKLEGDAMLAVWQGAQDDPVIRRCACKAAMEIAEAVRQFNESLEGVKLPTRIAVHAGEIFFGNIGTEEQYKYGVMGDTVNTASRMDGLNKYLGTGILVSQDVIHDLDGFLTREAGTFVFKGKTQRICVHELLSVSDGAASVQRNACETFAEGLAAFRCRSWDCAEEKFRESTRLLKRDRLSEFYLKLLTDYRSRPREGRWEGVVELEEK
jgi:adenylate cyclase